MNKSSGNRQHKNQSQNQSSAQKSGGRSTANDRPRDADGRFVSKGEAKGTGKN